MVRAEAQDIEEYDTTIKLFHCCVVLNYAIAVVGVVSFSIVVRRLLDFWDKLDLLTSVD